MKLSCLLTFIFLICFVKLLCGAAIDLSQTENTQNNNDNSVTIEAVNVDNNSDSITNLADKLIESQNVEYDEENEEEQSEIGGKITPLAIKRKYYEPEEDEDNITAERLNTLAQTYNFENNNNYVASSRKPSYGYNSYPTSSYGYDSYPTSSYGYDSYPTSSYGYDSKPRYNQDSYSRPYETNKVPKYDTDSYSRYSSYENKPSYNKDSYSNYNSRDSYSKPSYYQGKESYSKPSYYTTDSYSSPQYSNNRNYDEQNNYSRPPYLQQSYGQVPNNLPYENSNPKYYTPIFSSSHEAVPQYSVPQQYPSPQQYIGPQQYPVPHQYAFQQPYQQQNYGY